MTDFNETSAEHYFAAAETAIEDRDLDFLLEITQKGAEDLPTLYGEAREDSVDWVRCKEALEHDMSL